MSTRGLTVEAERSAPELLVPDDRLLEAGVAELAEYLGVPKERVRERVEVELARKGITVAEAWNRKAPGTSESIERFYQETDAYLFDLVVDHARPAREGYRRAALEALAAEGGIRRVLDFGGGIGEDAICFAEAGYEVTYYDLPGETSRYARWRFERRGLPVRVVTDPGELGEGFDALYTYDVLEHVVDPIGMIRGFHERLRPDGLLLVAHSFGLVGPDYPEHLPQHAHLDNIFARWVLPWSGFRLEARVGPWQRLHVARRRGRWAGSRLALRPSVMRRVSALHRRLVRLREHFRRGWR